MIFDDGATAIDLEPTGYTLRVEDPTVLKFSSSGKVIAAGAPQGKFIRRTRQIEFEQDDAALVVLKSFYDTNQDEVFKFTDEVGRIWNVTWPGRFDSSEVGTIDGGLHTVVVSLRLDSVFDDTGRESYANADVGQMSIQKTGESILNFPLAYGAPAQTTAQETSYREQTPGFLAVDPNRFTARDDKNFVFAELSRAFVSEWEDYVVDLLAGSANPFSLVHFDAATKNYRMIGGLSLAYDGQATWGGNLRLREEN